MIWAATAVVLAVSMNVQAAIAKPLSDPSPARTRTVFLAFLRAYNHHDLSRTMSFFARPLPGKYFDCDFASLTPVTIVDLAGIRRWLQIRIAEGDQFSSIQVQADNPQPYVAGILATRSNHILEAMQLGPLTDAVGSKFILDANHGDHIVGGVWVAANECGDPHGTPSITLRFPEGPSQMRTRAMTQAFIDAYDARLTWRVLALMGTRVRYSDSGYSRRQGITITDKTKLTQWLRARFRERDTLGQAAIVTDDPAEPYRAIVHVLRTSTALSRKNLSPYQETLTITLGAPLYDHITRVQISPAP
jgi:hypothetical protein